MKKENIKEWEIWFNMLRNPMEYAKSIGYVLISAFCVAAIVVIHVACTWRGE